MKILTYVVRVIGLVTATLLVSTASVADDAEKLIEYNGKSCMELKDHYGWSVGVSRSGDYCVAQDLHQSLPWIRLPHQQVPRDPLVAVRYSSNVTVDLMGRHLSAKIPYGGGIWHTSGGGWTDGKVHPEYPPYHTIKISNGRISTSKQATVFMVHAWNGKNRRFYSAPLGDDVVAAAGSLADSHGDLTQYRETEYVLENLTLESDNIVIIMQGKKNIIRHCKIIGGNGTVNLYGPNMTFEDNEIILNAKDPQKEGDEPAVALYLEDAAESVIRNNSFTIKGRAAKTDAIVLKNSANVVIEANTINGTAEVYRLLDDASSVKATANTVKIK